MRISKREKNIEITERVGDYCFLFSVICGEINIISSHRSIFKNAMKLDDQKMPSEYVPPFNLSITFFRKCFSLLSPGEYFFYGEDDGRRVRVYSKMLSKMGIGISHDNVVTRFVVR